MQFFFQLEYNTSERKTPEVENTLGEKVTLEESLEEGKWPNNCRSVEMRKLKKDGSYNQRQKPVKVCTVKKYKEYKEKGFVVSDFELLQLFMA